MKHSRTSMCHGVSCAMKSDEPESERLIRLLFVSLLFAGLNFWVPPFCTLICCCLKIYWLESVFNGFESFGVGFLFLFGLSLFWIATYGRLPWFDNHNNSTIAAVIGIGVMIFAFLMGHGGAAERNEAYCRGYDDGLHRRPPADFRLSPASENLVKFWNEKQHSNRGGNDETR